jgi:molybdopterin-containing oxidoreductase family iron-sulfur binding subunit
MKRAPYTYGADLSGQKYWRSLNEYAETPQFKEALEREFNDGATVLEDPVSRRSFMGLMGASLGLAGLAGCRRPEEKILPYNKRPEDLVPGIAQFYATVMPFAGSAIGLLVESHEGRPTKIEGNPQHPHSLGGTNAWAQATVLGLYDPERSRGPAPKGKAPNSSSETAGNWQQFRSDLAARAKAAADKGGQGVAILVETSRSKTTGAALKALQAKLPNAKIYAYDPNSRQNERDGLAAAFGSPFESSYELANAQVILSLDSDFLLTEGSPVQQAMGFAKNRSVDAETMNRLYTVESRYSITGSSSDHRLQLPTRDVPAFVAALAQELVSKHGLQLGEAAGALSGLTKTFPAKSQKWIAAVAADLARAKGAGVVIPGTRQPAAVHALAAAINVGLGNVGKTVKYVKPLDFSNDGPAAILELAQAMKSKAVETLLILGGNPVFDAPSDADFKAALAAVPFSVHLSGTLDETGSVASWHVPQAHFLESWDDAVANDGTAAIVQPLIAPLHGGLTNAELVERFLGGNRKSYELVRDAWQSAFGAADVFERAWRKSLHDGVIPNTTSAGESVTPNFGGIAAAVNQLKVNRDGVELVFFPDSHAYDGRFANNGWMQEMPDQMTKQSWGNAALISSAMATKLGVLDGDFVSLKTREGKSITLPALIAPGQAENSVAVSYGQGRTVGMNPQVFKDEGVIGVDAYPLRTSTGFFFGSGASITKAPGHEELARTQEHHTMEGRPLVREANLVQFRSKPDFAKNMVHVARFNLWDEKDDQAYDGLKWGMSIDLTTCIGCNACMVACQSENNIPLVGKDGVLRGREMHWLRIDRYYKGNNPDEPEGVLMQPIGCQHCENAPCELVCPVAATEHSPEGLNDMAYNRCVGTRYCANNCPYKVRRFNFFNYNKDVPELKKMQFNPNVTVRVRGVMEKCTYCVQRIQEGKIAAKREGRFVERNGHQVPALKDGEVVSACAQACPTQAIRFGDLNDANSLVAKETKGPRAYGLLAEINTRPRTSFLARITNPNPELETA